MKTYTRFLAYLAKFFLEWDFFRQICSENQQTTHFILNNFFFFENCAVYEIMC